MRAKRHAKILELITLYPITTQEELLQKLYDNGITATQATISRDIKFLRLVKALDENGIYRYEVLKAEADTDMSEKFLSIFKEIITDIDCAGNIVCIKCYTGMANAACAALDTMNLDSVVGTISGDDTIFVLVRSQGEAIHLKSIMQGYLD